MSTSSVGVFLDVLLLTNLINNMMMISITTRTSIIVIPGSTTARTVLMNVLSMGLLGSIKVKWHHVNLS